MRVLKLTLKRKWFDLINSGEKKHEYRKTDSQWIISRLKGKEYDAVEFANGYGKQVPRCLIEFKGWRVGNDGLSKWGATPGHHYIIIELGRVIEENQRNSDA